MRVQGPRVHGLGPRVQEARVEGLKCRVVGSRVWGLRISGRKGYRVWSKVSWGVGSRVHGLGFRVRVQGTGSKV
jgi:hypothetical protein